MTDKEQFDLNKKAFQTRKHKIKMLKFLKRDINRKLNFEISSLAVEDREEQVANLLSQLEGVEINILKLVRNKYSSKEYKFTPSREIKNARA